MPAGRRRPTRASLGTASLSISSLLVISSGDKLDNPVTLPPGRARLAIKPAPTGSPTFVITMGIVAVAFLAANAVGRDATTIRSTLRRTKSAASSRKLRQALRFLLGKSILEGDALSLNPSKLAQILSERLHENRAAGSSALVQETDADDFSCLLRRRRFQKQTLTLQPRLMTNQLFSLRASFVRRLITNTEAEKSIIWGEKNRLRRGIRG